MDVPDMIHLILEFIGYKSEFFRFSNGRKKLLKCTQNQLALINTTWFEVCMRYECKYIDLSFNGTNYLTRATYDKTFCDKLVEHGVIEFEEFLLKAGYVSWLGNVTKFSYDHFRIFTWDEPYWEETNHGLARVYHGGLHHWINAIRFFPEKGVTEEIREVMALNTDESERLLEKFTSGRRYTLTPYNYGFTFCLFKILFIVVFFPIYLPIIMLSGGSSKSVLKRVLI